MIVGVVVLAILAAVLAFLVLNGASGDPDATQSPGASASDPATPSTDPAESASASVAPSASAGAPPSDTPAPEAFEPDAVVATTVEALTLRADPGLDGEVLWRLRAGTLGFVIDGPIEADGYAWYHLSGMGLPYGSGCVTPEPGELLDCPAYIGWVAGATPDGSAWLEAGTPAECPPTPPTVDILSQLPFTMRLVCFDSEDHTYTAWWPELPEDAGLGGACAAGETDVGWLVCQNINHTVLNSDGSVPTGAGASWPVTIDPASGVTMPKRGQWVEVTGHFDDPAAQGCGEAAELMDSDPGALVFNCRLQFVLTAVATAPGP